jgi:hypothetical protein
MKGREGMEARDQAYADDTTDRIARPARQQGRGERQRRRVTYGTKEWQSTLSWLKRRIKTHKDTGQLSLSR